MAHSGVTWARWGAALAPLCLWLAAAGCGGDAPPRPAVLRIDVVDMDDGSPQAAVKLAVMDVATDRLLGEPLVTGSDGTAVAVLPAAGRFQVLAYPGGGRGVFALPATIALAAGPRRDAARCGGPDTLVARVVTWRRGPWLDRLPRISGTVVDGVTGTSLAGAFIATPEAPYLDDYVGMYSVREDVTDSQGRFHVADIPFTRDPETERLRQVLPLLVIRWGYAPTAWTYQPRPGDENLDVTGVTIALQPAGEAGVLRGRVVFGETPVGGVAVGLAFFGLTAADIAAPQAAPALGAVAVTDAQGRFALSAPGPGRYVIHPGYAPDDGWALPAAGTPVAVASGEEADAGDLAVVRAIRSVRPYPGEALADGAGTISWCGVAEADSYAVFLDGVWRGTTAAPGWTPLPDAPLVPGAHLLQLVGLDAGGRLVGQTETGVRFTVAASGATR